MRLARIAVVAVLLLAGCGGDDDTASSDAAADQASAEAAIDAFVARLEADGFAQASDDDEDEDDFEFESEECKAIEEQFPEAADELPGETASAESGSYERGEIGVEAMHTVEGGAGFVEDEEALAPVFELLRGDAFGPCIEEAFRIGMAEETSADPSVELEISDFEVEKIASDVGEESAGVQLAGTIGASGISFGFDVKVEFAREGRRAAFIFTSTIGQPDEPLDHAGYLALLLAD